MKISDAILISAIAGAIAYFAPSAAEAQRLQLREPAGAGRGAAEAQRVQLREPAGAGRGAADARRAQLREPVGPGRIVGPSPDLRPLPSRIEHGAVSIRNGGVAASAPSLATVNCHLPGQEGGCPDIPAALVAPYENPAYPNRLVVQIPAIQPGHTHSHMISFWDEVDWPSGTYVFEFVADADNANAESSEANNIGSHTWIVP